MQGIYRDGLSQPRKRAEHAAAEALSEGARLRGARRQLPRKLRRELRLLEHSLRRPIRCLDDAHHHEADAEAYRQAVEVAVALLDARAEQAPAGRRRRLIALLCGVGAVLPVAAAVGWQVSNLQGFCDLFEQSPNYATLLQANEPMCHYTEHDQCRQHCEVEGRCAAEGGLCVAVDATHCSHSSDCREEGMCSLHKGRCAVRNARDCATSDACREQGRCSFDRDGRPARGEHPGACVARRDDDCGASDNCANHGACVAAGGRCVERKRRSCAHTPACARDGLCTMSFTHACFAGRDADCRHAEVCLVEGMCAARDGRCVALANRGCERSRVCRTEGRCMALGETCVAPPPSKRSHAGGAGRARRAR